MPSPKHPCAHPGCGVLLSRKESVHCRNHNQIPWTLERRAIVRAANLGRTVSIETREKLRNSRISGPGEKACEFCNKPFRVRKPSRGTRFCSRECGFKNRRGDRAPRFLPDMPMVACRQCGKSFRQTAKTQTRIFCSFSCKGIWQKARQPNKGTRIERVVRDSLLRRGLMFVEQAPLENVAVVDFFIPAFHVVLFCDGDYWHRLPGRPERDALQTRRLRSAGFTVFRFWEKEILRDVDACLAPLDSLVHGGRHGHAQV